MKLMFLSFLLFLQSNLVFGESKIILFKDMVTEKCEPNEKVSVLLLKKTLIELLHGEGCEGKFSSLLIEQCEGLTCEGLHDIFTHINKVRSGSVIGD